MVEPNKDEEHRTELEHDHDERRRKKKGNLFSRLRNRISRAFHRDSKSDHPSGINPTSSYCRSTGDLYNAVNGEHRSDVIEDQANLVRNDRAASVDHLDASQSVPVDLSPNSFLSVNFRKQLDSELRIRLNPAATGCSSSSQDSVNSVGSSKKQLAHSVTTDASHIILCVPNDSAIDQHSSVHLSDGLHTSPTTAAALQHKLAVGRPRVRRPPSKTALSSVCDSTSLDLSKFPDISSDSLCNGSSLTVPQSLDLIVEEAECSPQRDPDLDHDQSNSKVPLNHQTSAYQAESVPGKTNVDTSEALPTPKQPSLLLGRPSASSRPISMYAATPLSLVRADKRFPLNTSTPIGHVPENSDDCSLSPSMKPKESEPCLEDVDKRISSQNSSNAPLAICRPSNKIGPKLRPFSTINLDHESFPSNHRSLPADSSPDPPKVSNLKKMFEMNML